MGLRFYRRLELLPGVTLNFSTSGMSVSFDTRGAKYTIGPRGQYLTMGIPGTGLYYTTKLNPKKSIKKFILLKIQL